MSVVFDSYLINSRGENVPDLGFGVSRNVELLDFTEMYFEKNSKGSHVYSKHMDFNNGYKPGERPSKENMSVVKEYWERVDPDKGTVECLLKKDGVPIKHTISHHYSDEENEWVPEGRRHHNLIKTHSLLTGETSYRHLMGNWKEDVNTGPSGEVDSNVKREIDYYIDNRNANVNENRLREKLNILDNKNKEDVDDLDYRLS